MSSAPVNERAAQLWVKTQLELCSYALSLAVAPTIIARAWLNKNFVFFSAKFVVVSVKHSQYYSQTPRGIWPNLLLYKSCYLLNIKVFFDNWTVEEKNLVWGHHPTTDIFDQSDSLKKPDNSFEKIWWQFLKLIVTASPLAACVTKSLFDFFLSFPKGICRKFTSGDMSNFKSKVLKLGRNVWQFQNLTARKTLRIQTE